KVSFPLPLLREVSINKISPPTEVQASPVTTPATSFSIYFLIEDLASQDLPDQLRSYFFLVGLFHGQGFGNVSDHLADLAFQISHPRLPCIVINDLDNGLVIKTDIPPL